MATNFETTTFILFSTSQMFLTRRSFFTGVLAVPALATPIHLSRQVRLGLVGADGHTADILRPLADWPDVRLVAVANAHSDPKAWAGLVKQPGVAAARHYETADELLAKEALDVVAICNNNGERAGVILTCLSKKLPVIAEKPFALSEATLQQVIRAKEAGNVPVGMIMPMRFEPWFLAMREVVRSGEVGEIAQIDAQKSYQLGDRPAWQKSAALYGSTILWIGIHMLDLMEWTSGRRFTQAASFESRVAFPEMGDLQNVTASVFRLDNGGTATLRMDYLRPATASGHGDDRLRLAGTKGVVEYQEATGVTVMSAAGAPRRLTVLPPEGSVFGDFLSQVYLHKKPALSWEEIVRANYVTLKAEEAARSGRIVAI